ncbi:putative transcription factor HSF-type-DNA-binding family [Helianthus annuus]|nr:putative transcription factor HSF-type-DNA-binding family [Helianthus annuus]
MADKEVEEIVLVSDNTEGSSSGDESGFGGGLLPEPVRGVRNCGRPPNFVTKLYELVSNKDTDSIISWVSNQVPGGATSFAIWNEVDFINKVLHLMSKSNNFDSFITQVHNYGFKKVSWDRREYANEWFLEGKPRLLKHIKRRNKKNLSEKEKLENEIKKLESESKEVDDELHAFKAYVDNTISSQQKILQAIANTMKSIFDHHRSHKEVVSSDNDANGLALVGQQNHETSELGESSFTPSCEILTEEVNTNLQ